jgi:ribonuclease HI
VTPVEEIVVFCDGGSRGNPGPAAIGAVVLDPSVAPPVELATVSERIGRTTNNVAEYRALIAGLQAAAPFGARVMRVRADSMLMIKQLQGEYRIKQPHLQPLAREAMQLLREYEVVDLQHVPRAENTRADALVNLALDAKE